MELENAELSEAKEKLESELKCLKRKELHRSELDSASDDGIDDGYGHWSTDEDDFPLDGRTRESPNQSLQVMEKPVTCSTCQAHSLEREELFNQLDELHQQLRAVKDVNELLREDVSQKSAQVCFGDPGIFREHSFQSSSY